MINRHIIRVYGEPQSMPKKDIVPIPAGGGRTRPMIMAHDYRVRTNPITQKKEKYDIGYKKRWADAIQSTVGIWMLNNKFKPYQPHYPLAIGYVFFISKSPRCKLEFPSQSPDLDNFEYVIPNALKRTPAKKVRGVTVEGPYPDGVLFYDDDQIVWRLAPSGVLWATEQHQPGVIIHFIEAEKIRDDIYRQTEELTAKIYTRQETLV